MEHDVHRRCVRTLATSSRVAAAIAVKTKLSRATYRAGMADGDRFVHTCSALNLINVMGEGDDGGVQLTLWRAIAGTLFLGQVEFTKNIDDVKHIEGSVSPTRAFAVTTALVRITHNA
jgi:hypothetical protein